MREFINADGIANRLRKLRSQFKGSFLLVEGTDDEKLYGMHIERRVCQIQIAHGKPNLLRALAILNQARFDGLLAIADADFSLLEGSAIPEKNLLFTDTHDVETMLLSSPALDKLLREFGGERVDPCAAREKLLELGKPLGYMRWLSARDAMGFLFDGLAFDKFISEKELSFDMNALFSELQNRSRKGVLHRLDIEERLASLMSHTHNPWHLCCGHDLIEILSIGFRSIWGSNKEADILPSRLEASLRLAYEHAFFATTRLWHSIRAWEKENSPFIILIRSA